MYYFLLLCSFFLSITSAYADVIPDNSHPLDRCVQIGTNQLLQTVDIISVIDGPIPPDHPISLIKQGECITQGYKFNGIQFYWKNKTDTISGALEKNQIIPVVSSGKNEKGKISMMVDLYGGYLNERDPLMAEKYVYVLIPNGTGYTLIQESYTPIYSQEYIIVNFFYHLIFTICIETVFLFLGIYVLIRRKDIKKISILFAGIFSSCITLPIFWYFLPFGSERVFSIIFIYECIIILFEAGIYKIFLRKLSWTQLMILSCIANVLSMFLGRWFFL